MKETSVILHRGKEKALKNRHHWIFSGAVKFMPEFENGSILPVQSYDRKFLGYAYFNKQCSIIGRMISFGQAPALETIQKNIEKSIALRRLFLSKSSNACRLINGEGDALPGLIVDQYDNVLVIQVSTLGMERLKSFVTDQLIKKLSPRCIYEKSNLPSRREEGLSDYEGVLYGKMVDVVEILENGVHFLVDIIHSQKTGFFLDQREMRGLVRSLAKDRKVLDCFSYTGGFAVNALKGGAKCADCLDSSEQALNLARKNYQLNNFPIEDNHFYAADAFDFLRQKELAYDFIIIDPPAFAKKKSEIVQACRGYKDIHRLVFQKIKPQSLVLTFSCSYFVDEALFQKVIFQAAQEAQRNVRIHQKHHMAFDHPINIYHPQSDYLKGFLLSIE